MERERVEPSNLEHSLAHLRCSTSTTRHKPDHEDLPIKNRLHAFFLPLLHLVNQIKQASFGNEQPPSMKRHQLVISQPPRSKRSKAFD